MPLPNIVNSMHIDVTIGELRPSIVKVPARVSAPLQGPDDRAPRLRGGQTHHRGGRRGQPHHLRQAAQVNITLHYITRFLSLLIYSFNFSDILWFDHNPG